DTYQTKLPPTVGAYPTNGPYGGWNAATNWNDWYNRNTAPSNFGTTMYFILPFMEQDNLYKSVQSNSWHATAVVKTYLAPGYPSMPGDGTTCGGRGATSYAANWHVFRGGWDEDWQKGGVKRYPASIGDGTSNTIFFAERYAVCGDPAFNGSRELFYVEHI